ncbi:MAG: carotenoid oxygenase family protein [Rhodobacter sp.]|nr:carotenoid oxygenase family protein [Paracoccaceae bacterium]MCC0077311.1 carotenoid oxygenase family protein [Rhodobacter sp.]
MSHEPDLAVTAANVRMFAPDGTPPPDAPDWIWRYDHPYLHGPFAPTDIEYDADDLEVEGEIPADLCGAYVMNGPSQRFEPVNEKYHYYDGDALLRAIYFRDGKASFRQKYLHNGAFIVEDKAGKAIWPGLAGPYDFRLPGTPIKDTSNTDVIFYNGKILSLWYMAGDPYQIDPATLETVGRERLGGKLKHHVSAHTKSDPFTGELFFFNYQDKPPYMSYGMADAHGNLKFDIDIDLAGPRSPHDMGLTENYAILHDLPFYHDVDLLQKHGRRVMDFHRDVPARFGLIDRFGRSQKVQWFEAEPCYILHISNSWEEGEWVHMTGCRQDDPMPLKDPADRHLASMMAYRRRTHVMYKWSFNTRTGETREGMMDDLNTEFPTINANFVGRKARYAYNQILPLPKDGSLEGRVQTFSGFVRYDLEGGATQRYDYGEGVYGSEAPIAPAHGATRDTTEGKAYAVTFTTDANDWTSACLIFDAEDITRPIAKVKIPRRISIGFHTTWVDGAQIWPGA